MVSAHASNVSKYTRSRRGSDAGLLLPQQQSQPGESNGKQPPPTTPNLPLASAIAGSRRNCINGGFPGPKARPSVVFSSQKLGVTVDGCAAFYSAVLSCAPEHPVTLSPVSTLPCLRVSPSLLVFSRENWMVPQRFRVSVLRSVYDDNNKDDRKLQVLEHVSSSADVRFSGNRVMFLPCNVLVHVSGRAGCYLFASGSTVGTAPQESKSASASWSTLHEFAQVELDSGVVTTTVAPSGGASRMSPTRDQGTAVARASVQSNQSFSLASALAGADAIGALAHAAFAAKRMSSRHTILTDSASSVSLVPSVQSSGDGLYHAAPRDGAAIVKVVARATYTAVLYKSGRWGVLGNMDVDYSSEERDKDPVGVNGSLGSNAALSRMLVDIDCGDAHVAALTEQGYVMTWGDGRGGRLGHGTHCSLRGPQVIRSLFHKRVVQLACGAQHTVVVSEDGDVYSWGYGKCGALGHGRSEKEQCFDSVAMPMEVLVLKHRGVAHVACGDAHTAVTLANGALLTCGWGEHGRLGRAFGNEFSSFFARVTGGAMKEQLCTFVTCGGAHTLALTDSKAVIAFGWNANGQLGLGDRRNRAVPTKLQYFDLDDLVVTSVSAGKLHSMALTQDARVFGWGSDELGQCGIGAFPQIYTVPHLAASCVGVNAAQVSAGASHSVVLAAASQEQLDAMQSSHPTRYAALQESYELFVRSDAAQRAKVLAYTKDAQDQRELAARKRKPSVDPSSLLAKTLQLQCRLERDLEVAQLSVTTRAPPRSSSAMPRSRTAGVLLDSRSSGSKEDRHDGAAAANDTRSVEATTALLPTHKRKVRCSSAALWRQTRLFTFDSVGGAFSATYATQTTRGRDAAGATTTATGGRSNRPMSASFTVSVQAARLSVEARQSLARMLNGDSETRAPQRKQGEYSGEGGDSSNRFSPETAPLLARFPVSRPQSAPSRAGATKRAVRGVDGAVDLEQPNG